MNTNTNTYSLFFDGCSKGNPGKAGAGAVIYKNDDEKETWSDSIFVGNQKTNNESEYTGLIIGLEEAVKMKIQKLHVFGDSELVIKQMNHVYKVKSENLLPLFNLAKQLEKQIAKIEYTHVFRHNNQRADQLSNEGLLKS